MPGMPVRLERDTILEALYEMRFQSKQSFTGSVFSGLLYSQKETRTRYSSLEELPAAKLPSEAAAVDPNLRYVATHRLKGEKYSVQIGAQSVALSCPFPYSGWRNFRQEISFVTQAVLKTELIEHVERFSLRYINLLIHDEAVRGLQKFIVDIKAGGRDLSADPLIASTHLRTELHEKGYIDVIQVASPATVEIRATNETKRGTLLDIDVIRPLTQGESFVDNHEDLLERCHQEEKAVFFSFLKPKTLEDLGPIYEE
ncbi:MAG: TIGR04255 family protein [Burkholderiales bacterium]